jgi:hypothetical protein
MIKYLFVIAIGLALCLPAGILPADGATLYRLSVSYRQGGEELKGYLAYDHAARLSWLSTNGGGSTTASSGA